MKYRYLIILATVSVLLFSCAGNQELVADKQSKIDSLTTLNSDLHKKLQGQDALQKELDKLKSDKASQDAELKDALDQLAKIQDVQVKGNRTVITNDLLFQSGSFKISSKGKKILDDIWAVLEDHPNREILIVGHTDNMPIHTNFVTAYRSNWDLSTWRALAVLHYIKALPNAHEDRLAVAGYGPNQPITSNDSDEGLHQNRRVEIVLGEKIN